MKFGLSSFLVISLILVSGCAPLANKEIRLQNLAKTEVDMIIDQHINVIRDLSRELTVKLYKRNPRELTKAAQGTTVNDRLDQLLGKPRPIRHPELNNLYALDALPLAFDPNFSGDRIFALMVAITGMLHSSYNYRDEFFILDEIDHQKLYNSARNLEKISWMLHNTRNADGEPLILSDSMNMKLINLSYARIFGKLIATQDMMAEITATSTDRSITRIVQGVATAPFLPI